MKASTFAFTLLGLTAASPSKPSDDRHDSCSVFDASKLSLRETGSRDTLVHRALATYVHPTNAMTGLAYVA